MKLHPRKILVADASCALSRLLFELERDHDLSYSDLFGLLSERASTLASGAESTAMVRLTATSPPRTTSQRVRHAFIEGLRPIQAAHTLTYGEWFSLLGNAIADLARYQIRAERHPDDPDKKGDEA